MKENKKYKEKAQWKSAKTAISGIFGQKRIFHKNTHLCAKDKRKLMMKSREKAKEPVFQAYFQHFRPEKYILQKSGSVTFKVLPFCISVQNFMKKYKVQLEKFKKYCFPAKIGCSGDFKRVPATEISFIDNWFMLDGWHCY